jgi:hypothetical protein
MEWEFCSVVSAEGLTVRVYVESRALSQNANYNQQPPVRIQTGVTAVNISALCSSSQPTAWQIACYRKIARQKRHAGNKLFIVQASEDKEIPFI